MDRSRRRRTRAQRSLLRRRTAIVLTCLALTGIVLGLAFAGSPTRLAMGVRIAGLDVGGMTPGAATSLLERRAAAVAGDPVSFRIGERTWRMTPKELGIRADWRAAVDSVRRQGGGFGPFRGFRRLDMRFFGAEVAPPTQVYDAGLGYELNRIAAAVDTPHHEAALVLHGLTPEIVPGETGRVLDRKAAAATIVRALAALSRQSVGLPVRLDAPTITPSDLTVAQAEVRTALSAPIRVTLGSTRWRVRPARLAHLLLLPADGRRELRIGGPGATRYFAALGRRVDRAPVDADWAITSNGVRVTPDRPGLSLDVPRSAEVVLGAALVTSPAPRAAELVVERTAARRSAADARAMGITGLVKAYETFYGGEAGRIHNVQLVAHLLDRHLIAPGAEFSFNQATGDRSAAKGFVEAPVIINGEVTTGLGGGVCQVSTTVFNAAYEAGLPITARTNHALYISHYPQGRDATVNYPDVDLKFVNNTGRWLLVRTFVGSSSLTVALYGTPVHRRVVSELSPLVETGPPPVEQTSDSSLTVGEKVVDDPGGPSRSTSVLRKVYSPGGKLLYESTFYSSYRAEPELVRVGTKPKPQPKPASTSKQPPVKKTPTTTTSATTTTPLP